MVTNPIGKAVYELIERNYSWNIDKSKTHTITAVKKYDEVNDYCNHYVIKDEQGNEKEVREYAVVFCPDPAIKNEDERLAKCLSDNGIYADVYTNSEGQVLVSISWGDWKHEHGWCRSLMGYLGYTEDDVIVTEDNGSDCYSAEHYFSKVCA